MSTSGRKLLIIAMVDSVHVANWVRMVRESGLRVYLLGAYEAGPLASIPVRRVSSPEQADALSSGEVGIVQIAPGVVRQAVRDDEERGYIPWRPHWMGGRVRSPGELLAAIDMVRPDLLHSMEIQFAGYLCAEAKSRCPHRFPPWLLSNWGSDVYLFKKQADHRPRLERVARLIDYYLPECRRDMDEMSSFGFTGVSFEPVPASGGFDLSKHSVLLNSPPPSQRRSILVKGYHGWSGRAVTALAAVRLAHRHLAGFEIRIKLAAGEVKKAAQTVAATTGLKIVCDDYISDHSAALARMAQARIAVGVGISDGISTSFLEAMAFGAFPIQSCTACVDEWTENGTTSFIISPHDSRQIAECLCEAAQNDRLVDEAARVNRRTIEGRWSIDVVSRTVLSYYSRILR